jgi:hypothetical protein
MIYWAWARARNWCSGMTDSMVQIVKNDEDWGKPMTHSAATQVFQAMQAKGINLDPFDMVYLENGRYASWALEKY